MMKKHRVKLKQPWIAEVGLNGLGHPLKKHSDEN